MSAFATGSAEAGLRVQAFCMTGLMNVLFSEEYILRNAAFCEVEEYF